MEWSKRYNISLWNVVKWKHLSKCSTSPYRNRTPLSKALTHSWLVVLLSEETVEWMSLWWVCVACSRTWLQCMCPVRCVAWPCWFSACTWWWTSGWPRSPRTWPASTRPTYCWSVASSSLACPSWVSLALWRRTAVSFWQYDTHTAVQHPVLDNPDKIINNAHKSVIHTDSCYLSLFTRFYTSFVLCRRHIIVGR